MELHGHPILHVIFALQVMFSFFCTAFYYHHSVGDDQQALIWDIQPMPQPIEVPILAYGADGEINQVQWSSSQPDWICICYRDNVEILRV